LSPVDFFGRRYCQMSEAQTWKLRRSCFQWRGKQRQIVQLFRQFCEKRNSLCLLKHDMCDWIAAKCKQLYLPFLLYPRSEIQQIEKENRHILEWLDCQETHIIKRLRLHLYQSGLKRNKTLLNYNRPKVPLCLFLVKYQRRVSNCNFHHKAWNASRTLIRLKFSWRWRLGRS